MSVSCSISRTALQESTGGKTQVGVSRFSVEKAFRKIIEIYSYLSEEGGQNTGTER